MSSGMSEFVTAPFGWRRRARQVLQIAGALPQAGISRLLAGTRRSPRFVGAYSNRTEIEAALARFGTSGYDDDAIADVSFEVMCRRAVWDYPILFWLSRLLPKHPALLDAGGHLGTKYIAFSDLLDLGSVHWTVYDLPGIVRAARARQAAGLIPSGIGFADRLEDAPGADILLVSGLLQYLGMPFPDFVASLQRRPQFILVNKVALSPGSERYSIERIGQARVAYRLRNRAHWNAEIAKMGYEVLDSWTIPELGHVIPTHPWLGRSENRGYVLQCCDVGR